MTAKLMAPMNSGQIAAASIRLAGADGPILHGQSRRIEGPGSLAG